jgi:hypothetical protein
LHTLVGTIVLRGIAVSAAGCGITFPITATVCLALTAASCVTLTATVCVALTADGSTADYVASCEPWLSVVVRRKHHAQSSDWAMRDFV